MKITIAFLILCVMLCGSYYFMNISPRGMRTKEFVIIHGENFNTIAKHLEKSALIKHKSFFLVLYLLHGRPVIQAGLYRITAGSTSDQVLNQISSGRSLSIKLTIPEGYTMRQIAERLASQKVSDSDEFLRLCRDRNFLVKLGIRAATAEGYLYPDTYFFHENSDPRIVIKTLYGRMKQELAVIGEYGAGGMTLHEILTLASLIEKEAKLPRERPVISSVFHNRLKKGMKLDCDPTVRYALQKFTVPLTYRDLECDYPYNTYRCKGMPPTPICSPGRESIKAALFPENTGYYFFVAENGGSHYFSKTLREHLKAVKKYRSRK